MEIFEILFLVAQWSRRLATNQKIPGSSPGGEDFFAKISLLFFFKYYAV